MRDTQTDAFRQREKSLEDAFFKDRDRELMDKMRRELESFEEKRKLAHVTGIVEEKVLHNLVLAGVHAETLAAVGFDPFSRSRLVRRRRHARRTRRRAERGCQAGPAAGDSLL